MKFSHKLSVTIFITGLISLMLLSFAMYRLNNNSVIKSQTEFTESIANAIADNINYLLSEKIKTALTLANSNTLIQALDESIASYSDLSDEKRNESIKQLNEKWKSTKNPADKFILEFTDNKAAQFLKRQQTLIKGEYGEIFLTNKYGALVASTSKLSTFAHGHKYWWLGSFNNKKGKVFFDDRGYDDSVGGYVMGLVVPVKKGTQIIGILKCNLNILGSISELISNAQHKLIGKFKLTRSGGMVVFEEGFEPLSTQIHDNIFEQLKYNDQGTIIINDSKEKYLVGFSQIKLTKSDIGHGFGGTFESIDHKKGNKGESWYVLCYRQMSIIQAPIIESIKSNFIMGISILIVLLFVSYLFGKKISQPLTILNKATQKIGKRDFEYKIELAQKDEFGILAHSFNHMTNRLKSTTTSIKQLEKEVAGRKRAEEQIKSSLNEKEMLLRELYHRTKNNMQVIISMINLQIHNIKDENSLTIFKETANKIYSMALVHEKLYQTRDLSKIDLKSYFNDLITLLKDSYEVMSERVIIKTDLDEVMVTIDTAIPCGLIMNELISNIFKHAFPGDQSGEIQIRLKKTQDDIEIIVKDSGIGLPPGLDFKNANTLGIRTITALAEQQLSGSFEYIIDTGTHGIVRFKDQQFVRV